MVVRFCWTAVMASPAKAMSFHLPPFCPGTLLLVNAKRTRAASSSVIPMPRRGVNFTPKKRIPPMKGKTDADWMIAQTIPLGPHCIAADMN